MLTTELLARAVVETWETGDLAGAVRALDQHLTELTAERAAHAAQIEWALRHQTDEFEIDEDPVVSVGEAGVWVSGWMYVPMETEENDDGDEEDSGC